jgi:uncharacterized protein YdeI (YjbR/CyaY-like superfamily)
VKRDGSVNDGSVNDVSRIDIPACGAAEVIAFDSAGSFEQWLDHNFGLHDGVWLKIAKKGSGVATLTSDEAVDIGLCFGWISGQRRILDETHYLQKYVPRRAHSRWSQVNVAKVETLNAAGRMRPSGVAEVDAAKADGRWAAAYQPQRDVVVPADLADALASHPDAQRMFDASTKTQRYALILTLETARTLTARTAKLNRAIATLRATPS